MTLRQGARKGRLTRTVSWRLALPLAIALGVIAATSVAKATGASRSSIQAKIRYCEDCHGTSAQGYRGYYPIPRLAGQQPQYLKNQLRAFIDRSRPNPIMSNVAHVLRPDMIDAIVAYFHQLHPAPIGGEPKRLVAAGRKIFENGVPQHNVAACAACHGPDATGHGEIPRLAGQLYPYVMKELTNWPKERGQNPAIHGASFIMLPVAHSLTRSEIKAVAAYVSSLR
jgi:cytochrome c553